MHEAPLQSMITIQDEVRAAFGWSEQADAASANAMMDFLQNHGYWTMNRRKDTFAELKQKLQNAPRVVIFGAAVEKSEITESARIGDVYVAANGAVARHIVKLVNRGIRTGSNTTVTAAAKRSNENITVFTGDCHIAKRGISVERSRQSYLI